MSPEGAVLITGAAGFGGSSLARALLALGYNVTGLDVAPPSHAALLGQELSHPRFRYVWKSIQDIQPWDVEGHTVVAHMAAQPDHPPCVRVAALHHYAERRGHPSPCWRRSVTRRACRR